MAKKTRSVAKGISLFATKTTGKEKSTNIFFNKQMVSKGMANYLEDGSGSDMCLCVFRDKNKSKNTVTLTVRD